MTGSVSPKERYVAVDVCGTEAAPKALSNIGAGGSATVAHRGAKAQQPTVWIGIK